MSIESRLKMPCGRKVPNARSSRYSSILDDSTWAGRWNWLSDPYLGHASRAPIAVSANFVSDNTGRELVFDVFRFEWNRKVGTPSRVVKSAHDAC